jgi:predicted secreted hydrolase
MHRRLLLTAAAWPLLGAPWPTAAAASLRWPRDFGSHDDTRTEWWYLTGWLHEATQAPLTPAWGFQVTFFRSRTGLQAAPPGHFDATQLIFAHAALSDLAAQRLRHDQRIARSGFGIAQAGADDTAVRLRDWQMVRAPGPGTANRSRYRTQMSSDAAGFGLDLQADATQPLLLQGVDGWSRKGPEDAQASRYYSEPQLEVQGRLSLDGHARAVTGRAWLDHEWSDAFLPPQAVGWDWVGMNLDDGSALTAFRLRRQDGTTVYAGGSFRRSGQDPRNFAPASLRFTPQRHWRSPASKALYPVEWALDTPAGRFVVRALLDAQELDSRASTGAYYWEGLSELLAADGRRVGLGYLEMTGYAGSLQL